MISHLRCSGLRTIRNTVVLRNSRWDVRQNDLPTPLIDCACREDALDYALGIAARTGDAILESQDDQGLILSRRNLHQCAELDPVSRIVVAVADSRFSATTEGHGSPAAENQ